MYALFSFSVHIEPEQGKLGKEAFSLISCLWGMEKLEEVNYAGKAFKKPREI